MTDSEVTDSQLAAQNTGAAILSASLTNDWIRSRRYRTPFSPAGLNRVALAHAHFLEALCDLSAAYAYRAGLDTVSEAHVTAASDALIGGSRRSEWLKWIGFF